MSAAFVAVALLLADAPLLALVTSTNIMAGVLPQGTTLPALGITDVVTTEISRIDAQASHSLVEGRVQVTILATDYTSQKQILEAVRKAMNFQRGTIAASSVVSVRWMGDGPDFSEAEVGFYMQSIDFNVIYNRPN